MHTHDVLLNRMKTVASINVLQPITLRSLSTALRRTLDLDQLPILLRELLKDGLIARENGYYRVTFLGMRLLSSRHVSTVRDVDRMKYLLATSKQRGGDALGR